MAEIWSPGVRVWEWVSGATGWRWTVVREAPNRYSALRADDLETLCVFVDVRGVMQPPVRKSKRRTFWPTVATARAEVERLDAAAAARMAWRTAVGT